MKKLSSCIDEFLMSLDIDERKIAQAAFNKQTYKNAVLNIWKDRSASKLILDSTNAFYIRRDDATKVKSSYKEGERVDGSRTGDVVCEIYLDDSMVLSELNAHREILCFALRSNNLTFDEMRLIHSRGSMRNRHPFKDED